MFRAARMMRDKAVTPQLQTMVAVGLRREFGPCFPLPLPPPFARNAGKHTLVLDIDETLLHTFAMTTHNAAPDEPAVVQDVPLIDYYTLLRPHVKEFLSEVNELFEVVFWTAGTTSYCSAILDGLERHVLQLPPSFYNYVELAKCIKSPDTPLPNATQAKAAAEGTPSAATSKEEDAAAAKEGADTCTEDSTTTSNGNSSTSTSSKDDSGTSHANFYALARSQTLQRMAYMKYLPMLGRPMKNIVMLDDNVRSFPLTPRHGVKVSPFDPDDDILQRYINAVQKSRGMTNEAIEADAALTQDLRSGVAELERWATDTALLDVLPVLRAVAQVPLSADVTKELDHWRDVTYGKCDDFNETMNHRSVVRQQLLGRTVKTRNAEPIAPLRAQMHNAMLLHAAAGEHSYSQFAYDPSKL